MKRNEWTQTFVKWMVRLMNEKKSKTYLKWKLEIKERRIYKQVTICDAVVCNKKRVIPRLENEIWKKQQQID